MDNRNFVAIISYDEAPTTELAPGEYLEQEFGWLQQSGFKLSDWALLDHDVLWEQYLLYLANWIVEHSSEPCHKGPDSFSQWKDNCTSHAAEEPLCLIGCEENSYELAIENGPVNELTVLHTIDEALTYVQNACKRLMGPVMSCSKVTTGGPTILTRSARMRFGMPSRMVLLTLSSAKVIWKTSV